MTPERLLTLIDAYGADPLSWPEVERDAGRALLTAKPELFQEALANARALDAELAEMRAFTVPSGLASRIVDLAPQPEKERPLTRLKNWFLPDGQLWPAAVTAASLLVGVMVGYSAIGTETALPTSEADDAFYTALETDYSVNFEEIGR